MNVVAARDTQRLPELGELIVVGRDGLRRRGKRRQRFWQPALTGNRDRGRAPVQREMHFHDLRHTHETWLVEDQVPGVLRLQRLGQRQGPEAA